MEPKPLILLSRAKYNTVLEALYELIDDASDPHSPRKPPEILEALYFAFNTIQDLVPLDNSNRIPAGEIKARIIWMSDRQKKALFKGCGFEGATPWYEGWEVPEGTWKWRDLLEQREAKDGT